MNQKNNKKSTLTVGLFGIGLDTYWGQFESLLSRLSGYLNYADARLAQNCKKVINAGMVDNYFKSQSTADMFKSEAVDCLVLFVSTYALSQNVLPVIQKNKVPLIILNLQPDKAINYSHINSMSDRGKMTGEWLAYCQSCVAPELASVFNRTKIDFQLISGYLKEEYVWQEVKLHLQALDVIKKFKNNRVGVMGHYYNGMLDVYSDLTQLSAVFGNHFEIIEFGLLKKIREKVTSGEIGKKIDEFQSAFQVSPACEMQELQRAAKTAVSLDKLVENEKLNALAYYFEGVGDNDYQDIVTSLIPGLTLLTSKNVPVAGEYEIKNIQAMKIMDMLGAGGSFSEFYALDFNENIILLGHDGPAHFEIAEGRVGLVPVPVYHGKPGNGLSIQMQVKTGDVTLLSVAQNHSGEIFFVCAEGESVSGETLQIGNTNSRYSFSLSVREFINNWSLAGPSHHCAIGMGHHSAVLKKIAGYLKIELIQIC